MRPDTLAEVATRHLAGERFDLLVPEFLDEFYRSVAQGDLSEAQGRIDEAPPALPDVFEHALLGAIGEHLARRWDLRIPLWTEDPTRFLDRARFTTSIEGFKALLLAESPIAFRRRLIFTEAEPLRRARMPRGFAPWRSATRRSSAAVAPDTADRQPVTDVPDR